MIAMILNDYDDGCVLDVGVAVGWGPSGPAPPLALTPGPSPAQRERGVCSWWIERFGWCFVWRVVSE